MSRRRVGRLRFSYVLQIVGGRVRFNRLQVVEQVSRLYDTIIITVGVMYGSQNEELVTVSVNYDGNYEHPNPSRGLWASWS